MYTDAARFYDVIHDGRGRDVAAEADTVIAEVVARCPRARSLLDVACGTGTHLPQFAEAFDVHGVDLSEEMLALAAERCPSVPLAVGDMRSFDLGRRFDAVVCLFSAIGYVTDAADAGRAVATMASHLEPGGVLLIEGWIEPDEWLGENVFADSGSSDDVAAARVSRTRRDGLITDIFMRYTAATLDEITTVDEHHTMRLSDPAEFEAHFAAAGLSFERLPTLLRSGRAVYAGVAPASK
jgi:SAM-dependent methyltransferase